MSMDSIDVTSANYSQYLVTPLTKANSAIWLNLACVCIIACVDIVMYGGKRDITQPAGQSSILKARQPNFNPREKFLLC